MADVDYFTYIARTVFKRTCVECPANQHLICPNCAEGSTCQNIPTTCSACTHNICVPDPSSSQPTVSASPAPSGGGGGGGANIGGIVGGVVGGVAAIIIVTFLLWKFCLRRRRSPYGNGGLYYPEKSESELETRQAARLSTHTVASVASTAMTRASNVIQIAYIPGIENRSDTDSPSFVPPVPTISQDYLRSESPRTPYTDTEGQHFFTPEDLRDSTYSENQDYRQSTFSRQSVANSMYRNSVASTVYRSNAIVSPVPARQIIRGKANVVSVKSSPSQTPHENSTNGAFDYIDYGVTPTVSGPVPDTLRSLTVDQPPMPRRNSRNMAAFSNNPEASLLQAPSAPSAPSAGSHGSGRSSPGIVSDMSPDSAEESQTALYEDPASSSEPSLSAGSTASSPDESTAEWASNDSANQPPNALPANLAAVIQEATRRASSTPRHGGLGSVNHTAVQPSSQNQGPFSDENAI